jgi:hypothetical protein
MGRTYTSAVEAIAAGSCCNIQLDIDVPIPPLPGVPLLQIPDLPSVPSISYFCACDEEAEEPLE